MFRRRTLTPATWIATALLLTAYPAFAEFDLYGKVTLTSDYMFRGSSQTMSSPALQAELGFEHENGWYGYAWGSNVDYMDDSVPDDGSRVEFNFGVGYWHALSDDLAVLLEVTSLVYPGTNPGYDYDYEEIYGKLTFAEHHGLTIGYSPRVFGEDDRGIFYALNTGFGITTNTGMSLELGHYDLEPVYNLSYSYAELSLHGEFEFLNWRLSYFSATDSAEELYFESTVDDRIVVAMEFLF